MEEKDKRKYMLKRVREAIREWKFTPRELSIPSEADAIMILLSVDEFPYKMPFTKLAIICYIGSRGVADRQDLMNLLNKDYTTISHNLTDLREYGFLNETVERADHKRSRIRKYTLTESGKHVFEEFISFYQQKIIETSSTMQLEEAPMDKPKRRKEQIACALATFSQLELPL
jgi:DNA-binding PadR family transcriptional regulator